jgi:hypothetical protein
VSRLRSGERTVAGGSLALLVLLCLNWFSLALPLPFDVHQSGWASLGWLVIVLLLAQTVSIASLLVITVRGPLEQQLRTGVAAATLSSVVAPVLVLRVLLFQPGLGVGAPNSAVSVLAPAYLGLVAELVVVAGTWRALADERTDAPESAYQPPEPRPVPPSA